MKANKAQRNLAYDNQGHLPACPKLASNNTLTKAWNRLKRRTKQTANLLAHCMAVPNLTIPNLLLPCIFTYKFKNIYKTDNWGKANTPYSYC